MFNGRSFVTAPMGKAYINWAKGKGLSKKFYFPSHTSKPGTRPIVVFHTANFAVGQKISDYYIKPLMCTPGPFQTLCNGECVPAELKINKR